MMLFKDMRYFILYYGVMLLERVTGHISYILLMNIITYITVNIDVRTTNLNTAYPQERQMLFDDDPSMSK